MRAPILFSAMIAFTLCSALSAHAGDAPKAATLAATQQTTTPVAYADKPAKSPTTSDVFIELLAADFFESDLRLAQSRQIEAETANYYLSLDETGRARFRAERRAAWRELRESERAALRGAKLPRFANLDEAQKQTFRRIALQELGVLNASDDI